ncbi:MAG: ABC transporter ATP-binding protein, partial [Bacteroidota bacterium]
TSRLTLNGVLDTLTRTNQRKLARPMEILLEVRNLSVDLFNGTHAVPIISGVSFSLEPGKTLILLGESGGGKTILTRALTNLFPQGSSFVVTGDVVFNKSRLSDLSREELTLVRRRSIRYVFQEPGSALNPLATIRSQMALADITSGSDGRRYEKELTDVGITEAATVLRSFPHQLSIGMAQRVMIAMALLPEPALLIVDEPTSAVDADSRGMILDLLSRRQRHGDMAMVVTTHDIEVARALGHRVIMMLGGSVVEAAPADQFLTSPLHPYVQEFLGTNPHTPDSRSVGVQPLLAETPATPSTFGKGCVYAGRCPKAREMCWSREPQLESAGADREVRCFFWK